MSLALRGRMGLSTRRDRTEPGAQVSSNAAFKGDLIDMRLVIRGALLGESQAIALVAELLPADIERAAKMIAAAEGRVAFTGIGKSGHVARKIAATFSSIGKPAQFVHASEASHGDLGALAPGDIVVALSHSGETAELSDIVAYCTHWGIPLLALTGNGESSLAQRATFALVYPKVREVCAIGRAPTTSTILMMAIGDALAVALTHLLGTSEEQFGRHHPGGTLGARLRKVCDLMHSGEELPVVDHASSMNEAVIEMSRKGFGMTLVRDASGELSGLITDGDLRRKNAELWHSLAGDVANFQPRLIGEDALAEEALLIMRELKVTCLPVTGPDSRIRGLIHIHDCLRGGL